MLHVHIELPTLSQPRQQRQDQLVPTSYNYGNCEHCNYNNSEHNRRHDMTANNQQQIILDNIQLTLLQHEYITVNKVPR